MAVVALTGATGFIGSHTLKRLLEAGHRVKALYRSPEKKTRLEDLLPTEKIKWIQGDLGDQKALEKLLAEATHLVHLAGAIKGETFETFGQTNLKGFLNLLSLWPKGKPFLYLSSLAAREPYLSPYAGTKRLAEEFLKSAGGTWCIFRPPAVYGPGDQELRPLIKLLSWGLAPVLGPGRFSLIHVKDLAEAICRWVNSPLSKRLYELHDGKPGGYSWFEVAEIAERVFKRRVKVVPLKKNLLAPLAWTNLFLGRTLKRPPMLNPWKLNELFHVDWVCDNRLIEQDLSWKPRFQLEEGLRSLIQQV